MRLSQLFAPRITNPPSTAELSSLSTKELVERAGLALYAREAAGFYDVLPLGWRVIRRIITFLRQLSDARGFQEMLLSSAQPRRFMEKSGRMKIFGRDVMGLTGSQGDSLVLSPAHEEHVTDLFRRAGILAHTQLPIPIYTFDKVFRGIGHRSSRGLAWTSQIAAHMVYVLGWDLTQVRQIGESYCEIISELLRKMEIRTIPVQKGPDFVDFIMDATDGRDKLRSCPRGHPASGDEGTCLVCEQPVQFLNGLSLAMYFIPGTTFAERFGHRVRGPGGYRNPCLGTGGFGLTRALIAMVESHRDALGLRWPDGFAPFDIAVMPSNPRDPLQTNLAEEVYRKLLADGVDALLDDRKQPKHRERSLDFLGIPRRWIVGWGLDGPTISEQRRSGDVAKLPLEVALGPDWMSAITTHGSHASSVPTKTRPAGRTPASGSSPIPQIRHDSTLFCTAASDCVRTQNMVPSQPAMIRIFDTLRGQKVPFEPLHPPHVGIYLCGPTVYDNAHLGHARSSVAWDILVRHLRARGYEVRFVMNYTDVDDKIIRRARELGEDPVDLSARYVVAYREDMAALGNVIPDAEPKVTEHLPDIIALIEKLVERKCAYAVESGDVYFSVRSFPEYGRLSRRNIDDLLAGARVEVGEIKRDPLDFALWKASKPGEPSWESPWGLGRPGWHIECSAMTLKHLGAPFDIHAGGMDLIFPHHTNEIAQSVCALPDAQHVESFCRYWMHNGFVEVNQEKMAKSLGNFVTIRSLLAQFDGEVMRLALLSSHYRSPISFSLRLMEDAEERLIYFYSTIKKVAERLGAEETRRDVAEGTWADAALAALDDDLNTAVVLALVADAFRDANVICDRKGRLKPEDRAELVRFARGASHVGHVLSLCVRAPEEALLAVQSRMVTRRGVDVGVIERLMAERLEARRTNDFARSDAIREDLKRMGVAVMDGPNGATWRVES